MTYWSRYSRMAVGLGRSSSLTSLVSASSSSMISLHRSMHSSQMYTPGPAISLRTCFWLLPQKEHFSRSPPSPMRAMSPLDLDLASSGLVEDGGRSVDASLRLTVPGAPQRGWSLPRATRTRLVAVYARIGVNEGWHVISRYQ